MATYKIVRFFFRGPPRTVKVGLTLEEAQAHCRDPETSSKTCCKAHNVRRTRESGPWFDGYNEEPVKQRRARGMTLDQIIASRGPTYRHC